MKEDTNSVFDSHAQPSSTLINLSDAMSCGNLLRY